MIDFLKKLVASLYKNTIGTVVRLYQHAREACVDQRDHSTITRIVIYTGFVVLLYCFPEAAAFIAMLRMMVTMDVIGSIASVLQDTANAYKEC